MRWYRLQIAEAEAVNSKNNYIYTLIEQLYSGIEIGGLSNSFKCTTEEVCTGLLIFIREVLCMELGRDTEYSG
jgi:hypothetical protein